MTSIEVFRQLQTVREEVDALTRLILDEGDEAAAAPLAPAPDEPPEAPYLSACDLAERFHVTPATIYRWAREGRLPAGKYWGARTRRWKASEVDENGYSS